MDHQVVADLLLVTRQIYQLSRQFQAEAERYQQIAEKANELELKLRHQLETLLTRSHQVRMLPALSQPASSTQTGAAVPEPEPLASVPLKNRPQLNAGCPTLKVYCFGPFQVYIDDTPITEWNSLKARAIFKYLVVHKKSVVGKETLMELFWPEAEPEAARRNLHQAIYSLRHTLRQSYADYQPILFENDGYLLNPEVPLWVDYVEFEHQGQAGQWLERTGRPVEAAREYGLAEALYRADFLEEDVYEDWSQGQREYLRQTYLDLSDRLSDYYLQQRAYPKVLQLCQKMLKLDACDEAAHRRLMQCYQAQGQRHLAVRQYHSCVQTLRAELEVPPSPETQALYDECIRNFGQTALG